MNTLLPYFAQVPMLAALSDETQGKLERTAEQRQYRRRQVIHFPDQSADSVYLLCDGRVKLSRVSDQGREVTLYLIENNGIFGEAGLIGQNQTYDMMSETLQDSHVVVFKRAELANALSGSPAATHQLLTLINERRGAAESAIADLIFLEVPKRLAKLLIRLNDSHGSKSGRNGNLIKAKFTHQELANMIGSTRETTTLILNEFKRQGVLDFAGRRIVVKETGQLEEIMRSGTVKNS